MPSSPMLAMLALFFAVVALLLAGVGLYSVLHYSVLQRRHEIGIRMAIGAQAGVIVRLVTIEVCAMVVAGALAGIAIGMTSARTRAPDQHATRKSTSGRLPTREALCTCFHAHREVWTAVKPPSRLPPCDLRRCPTARLLQRPEVRARESTREWACIRFAVRGGSRAGRGQSGL